MRACFLTSLPDGFSLQPSKEKNKAGFINNAKAVSQNTFTHVQAVVSVQTHRVVLATLLQVSEESCVSSPSCRYILWLGLKSQN